MYLPKTEPARSQAIRLHFQTKQMAAQVTAQAVRDFRLTLAVRYGGNVHYASATEKRQLEKLEQTARRKEQIFVDLVQIISPRDWTRGVPAHWVISSLTVDDAITAGQLTVIPPPAWGYTDQDSRVFAQAIA